MVYAGDKYLGAGKDTPGRQLFEKTAEQHRIDELGDPNAIPGELVDEQERAAQLERDRQAFLTARAEALGRFDTLSRD
jgi:hypothetical protein